MKNTFSSSSITQGQQTPNGVHKSSIEDEFRPLTRDGSSNFNDTTIEAQDYVSDTIKAEKSMETDIEAGNNASPKKSTGSSSEEEEAQSQALSLLVFFALYIFIGAALLSAYEPDMSFFKAIYFNFVSLSSIGESLLFICTWS